MVGGAHRRDVLEVERSAAVADGPDVMRVRGAGGTVAAEQARDRTGVTVAPSSASGGRPPAKGVVERLSHGASLDES
jgi:hypothetical protein